ncbi:membrane protein YoeI [Buttiauxella gaviniae]|uniref:Membrane protein YoeI n=1 Tax=Buttiauxella gaviniae TaxID=82990 RepID=A0ABV3NXW7_9ENTR
MGQFFAFAHVSAVWGNDHVA